MEVEKSLSVQFSACSGNLSQVKKGLDVEGDEDETKRCSNKYWWIGHWTSHCFHDWSVALQKLQCLRGKAQRSERSSIPLKGSQSKNVAGRIDLCRSFCRTVLHGRFKRSLSSEAHGRWSSGAKRRCVAELKPPLMGFLWEDFYLKWILLEQSLGEVWRMWNFLFLTLGVRLSRLSLKDISHCCYVQFVYCGCI